MSVKRLSLLGSTGSIGQSTLSVVEANPDAFRVVALAAGRNVERLIEQALEFSPEVVAIRDKAQEEALRQGLAGTKIQVTSGEEGVIRAATWESAQMVVAAIVGAAGLKPTLEAVRAGKDIGLANKECLVTAGDLFMSEVAKHQVKLLPIDSEHSAIFQVLEQGKAVRRIILTASGGPFHGWSRERLSGITPAQALQHPNWDMGPKITIDSATLMNKGLEVIEAYWLFGCSLEQIEVVVHPQSIIHSMVDYVDGSVLAHLGNPDMRTPIGVALGWPERIPTAVKPLDFKQLGGLTFDTPDLEAFPCLSLAYQAIKQGGTAPAVLNGANEVAVEAFLEERIGFTQIPQLIGDVLAEAEIHPLDNLEVVAERDLWARAAARRWINREENTSQPTNKG